MELTDVIIIGGGPAGVTAALYTARAGLNTTILYKDLGALTKASVENFYGHKEIGGAELVKIGLAQAKNVGAKLVKTEALSISPVGNMLAVATTKLEYTASAVLISTGASRVAPRIKGLGALEGKGISYCAICDGFFHKGKDVAVIGSGPYALHEVEDLLPIAKSVTVLTNGKKPTVDFPLAVTIRTEKISEICGQSTLMGERLSGVMLDGGEVIGFSGVFVAIGVAGGTELAMKLGAVVTSNAISADESGRTTVPGLWAAGDCTGGLKQIAKAVHEGAEAGTDIVRYMKLQKKGDLNEKF